MGEVLKHHYLPSGQVFNIDVRLDTLPPHYYKHRHYFFEICAVVSGNGREVINGREFPLRKGVVTFLLPWHIHELYSDEDDPVKLIRCSFGMEIVMDSNDINSALMRIIYSRPHADPSIQLTPESADRITGLFETLLKEFGEYKSWKEVMLKAKITEILICFSREREDLTRSIQKNGSTVKKGNDLSYLLTYIQTNWNKDITHAEIAKEFNIGSKQLDAYCQENTGLGFQDYLNEVRVRYCCALLSNSDLKISEISSIAGYNSVNTFNRIFKWRKGMTPKEYKRYYYSPECETEVNKVGFPSPLMWKIYHYIQLHSHDDISLSSLAKAFHYSESSISEICKREARQNFADILHECRILHACSLLSSTDKDVLEIGFEVGFNSSETFFRVFKKYRRMSPNEYRRQLATASDYAPLNTER